MKASSPAEIRLTQTPMAMTEAIARTVPNTSALPGSMRPAGIGRFMVRCMCRSMSRSYHMLMAPEAPAPMEMHRIATKASSVPMAPGAMTRPTMAVNTTRDITRGFSNRA